MVAKEAFPLQAFTPAHYSGAEILTVYIEGDGLAWRNRYTPSSDPTPTNPVGLKLALADSSPAVAYLARPCQYLAPPGCRQDVWTGGRFSPEAVAAADTALSELKAHAGARRLVLVGYSGGGVIAALVSAGRPDVVGLITVAAPLDVDAWVRHHDVDPLATSLDPAQYGAGRLARLPQYHIVGSRDKVVPRAIVDSFRRHLPADAPARIETVESTHECCYVSLWPALSVRIRDTMNGAAIAPFRSLQ